MRGGGWVATVGGHYYDLMECDLVAPPHTHLGGHDIMVCGEQHSLVDVATGKEVGLPDDRNGDKGGNQGVVARRSSFSSYMLSTVWNGIQGNSRAGNMKHCPY